MEQYVYELLRPSIPSWAMEWGFFAEFSLLGWCKRGTDNLLTLTRCGPFIPPIPLPESDMGRMIWGIIITDDFKQLLANSDLTGFTFRPVIKRHIIAMQWENWVLTATEPPVPIDVYRPTFSADPIRRKPPRKWASYGKSASRNMRAGSGMRAL